MHERTPTKKVDFYEYTRVAIIDSQYVWKLLENTFLELQELDAKDKLNLFSNFFPKWTLFESAIQAFQKCEAKTFFAANGKPAKRISRFYKDCMTIDMKMNDAEVLRIFEPYWQSYYKHVAFPLFDLKFDQVEHMAILAMMLLDPGYTNISEQCSNMCRGLRKVIQTELKGYYLERNKPEERLFLTMEALMLMEVKGSTIDLSKCPEYPVFLSESRLLVPRGSSCVWCVQCFDGRRVSEDGRDAEDLKHSFC